MNTVEPNGETDYRQEVRNLLTPFLHDAGAGGLACRGTGGSCFPGRGGRRGRRRHGDHCRSNGHGALSACSPSAATGDGPPRRVWANSLTGRSVCGRNSSTPCGGAISSCPPALSGIGDAVIMADVGGRITFLNPVAEKLTAWQEQDALGREVKTVLTLVDEQDRAALADPATAILAASLRLDFPPHTAQVARTGERRPVTGSGTPIWEEHGRPGGVALVFRDVSERRGAAETLLDMKAHREASEARAEAILETALGRRRADAPGGRDRRVQPRRRARLRLDRRPGHGAVRRRTAFSGVVARHVPAGSASLSGGGSPVRPHGAGGNAGGARRWAGVSGGNDDHPDPPAGGAALRHSLAGHQRPPGGGGGFASGTGRRPRRRPRGEPRKERPAGEHERRTPHPAQRRHRLQRNAARRGPRSRADGINSRLAEDPRGGQASAVPDQRHSGPVQDRSRPDGTVPGDVRRRGHAGRSGGDGSADAHQKRKHPAIARRRATSGSCTPTGSRSNRAC